MLRRVLYIFVCLVALASVSSHTEAAANLDPPPVIIEIPKLDGAVTIDGNMGEAVWSQARRIVIPRALLEVAPARANDVSGEARLFWNDNGLYIAFKVDDRKLVLAGEDDSLREYDAVQFWFDRLWIQVGLTSGGGSRCTVTNLGKYVPLIDTYIQAAASRITSGYTAEIFVPNSVAKSYLGASLQNGNQIRIAFGINNRYLNDRAGHVGHSFPNRYGFNTRESFAIGTLQ
jgi:uncharacterized protein YcfL